MGGDTTCHAYKIQYIRTFHTNTRLKRDNRGFPTQVGRRARPRRCFLDPFPPPFLLSMTANAAATTRPLPSTSWCTMEQTRMCTLRTWNRGRNRWVGQNLLRERENNAEQFDSFVAVVTGRVCRLGAAAEVTVLPAREGRGGGVGTSLLV